ncbi:hypothetical protein BN59_02415 [Legionella massiliensis]|uniref:Uncharacterized protein n=1 Tax=Legionella massiliensis TaxID=1034943 RepID=A0A078L262_9GAMM|nr:hypothetical protein BN59_02415 [Legionella massiliensis]CEE13846.1 hypothetical protein BN1094_02415 [Legionella massiliensis]
MSTAETREVAKGKGRRYVEPSIKVSSVLIKAVNGYESERAAKEYTYHYLSFLQFNKTDKLAAASHFVKAVLFSDRFISDADRSALNNGKLCTTIENFLNKNAKELQKELGSKTELTSVDQLIDFLNQRDPISTLIRALEDYHKERKEGEEYYGWFIFNLFKFSKADKLNAVEKLIKALQGVKVTFSSTDIAALNQGTLRDLINEHIWQNGMALADKLQVDEISCLDDLIEVYSEPVAVLNP